MNDDEYREYHIEATHTPSRKFRGKLLASASTWREGADRWKEMRLYETEGGRWVLHSIGHTTIEGETTFHSAIIFKVFDKLRTRLGQSSLGMDLAELAGIEPIHTTVHVD